MVNEEVIEKDIGVPSDGEKWFKQQSFEVVIPRSYHYHVIRNLTYLLALNPSSWSGKSWLLSIFHGNSQHCTSFVV